MTENCQYCNEAHLNGVANCPCDCHKKCKVRIEIDEVNGKAFTTRLHAKFYDNLKHLVVSLSKEWYERGNYNEIQTDDIGDGTIIDGWVFIGKGAKIGKNCKISNYVNIDSNCVVGDNTSIQVYSVLNSGTIVGKNCLIAGHVGTVDERYPTPFTKTITRQPCKIGDNVMIGEGAKLVSVTIGDNSVIGTGATVVKDVPPNEVWIGSPAKFYCTRKDFDLKQQGKKA